MSLRSLQQRPAGRELVRFCLQRVRYLRDEDGEEYVQLDVEDFSGTAKLRVEFDWDRWALNRPDNGALFESTVSHRFLDGRLWLEGRTAEPLMENEMYRLGPALFPRSGVPEPVQPALDELVEIFNRIEPECVRMFLGRVFTDPHIAGRFMRSRASANHHHNYKGGLLEHSVGVAQVSIDLSHEVDPELRDIITAGALMHDIGKIETVGEGPSRPMLGRWVQHEALTLEILAPHLGWLDAQWPKGGALLRNCLTWYAVKPPGFSSFVGADIIRAADQINVAMAMGKGTGEHRFDAFRSCRSAF
ncbi:HD domain-containing protein [Thermomonas sp.]|uniref:HD domain-containing protein n=1 Tax=Thermomonas sp. TaxID=1971895 RepID=UPI002606B198|nr:HD domain-containing protein [Thermomonas sp.]